MTKTCSRCGKVKPVEQFRKYHNGDKTFRHCLDCERIELRRRYIVSRGDAATDEQLHELYKINALYEARFKAGLSVPGRIRASGNGSVLDLVDEQLNEYKEKS